MAKLVYGGNVTFNMTNDLLVSVQRVMEIKFADSQGFWFEHEGQGAWFHPSIPVLIQYDDDEPIRYSRERTSNLVDDADGLLGVSLGPNSVLARMEIVDPDWEKPVDSEGDTSGN